MSDIVFSLATLNEVKAILELLADDPLVAKREQLNDIGLEKYEVAFLEIEKDPRNELWVAMDGNKVVGTWQVTYIPYLSRGASERCLIEAVRVASKRRGKGIGANMMRFALQRARSRGCALAQLTTDKSRNNAHKFYEGLGFVNSHEGMKMEITKDID